MKKELEKNKRVEDPDAQGHIDCIEAAIDALRDMSNRLKRGESFDFCYFTVCVAEDDEHVIGVSAKHCPAHFSQTAAQRFLGDFEDQEGDES